MNNVSHKTFPNTVIHILWTNYHWQEAAPALMLRKRMSKTVRGINIRSLHVRHLIAHVLQIKA